MLFLLIKITICPQFFTKSVFEREKERYGEREREREKERERGGGREKEREKRERERYFYLAPNAPDNFLGMKREVSVGNLSPFISINDNQIKKKFAFTELHEIKY